MMLQHVFSTGNLKINLRLCFLIHNTNSVASSGEAASGGDTGLWPVSKHVNQISPKNGLERLHLTSYTHT